MLGQLLEPIDISFIGLQFAFELGQFIAQRSQGLLCIAIVTSGATGFGEVGGIGCAHGIQDGVSLSTTENLSHFRFQRCLQGALAALIVQQWSEGGALLDPQQAPDAMMTSIGGAAVGMLETQQLFQLVLGRRAGIVAARADKISAWPLAKAFAESVPMLSELKLQLHLGAHL